MAINPGDEIDAITLGDGQSAQDYDFGKLLPNSISGRVLVSDTLDCTADPNPTPLAGVTVELLNSTGQVISTTTTDAQGNYQFSALPGNSSVADVQPAGYIPGCGARGLGRRHVGGHSNLISSVQLISDVHGTGSRDPAPLFLAERSRSRTWTANAKPIPTSRTRPA